MAKSIFAAGHEMTKADVRFSASYELHGVLVREIIMESKNPCGGSGEYGGGAAILLNLEALDAPR